MSALAMGLPSYEVRGLREYGALYHGALTDADALLAQVTETGLDPVTHEWRKGHSPEAALPAIVYQTIRRCHETNPTTRFQPIAETVRSPKTTATRRDLLLDILQDLLHATTEAVATGEGLSFVGGEALQYVYSHTVLHRALDRLEALMGDAT